PRPLALRTRRGPLELRMRRDRDGHGQHPLGTLRASSRRLGEDRSLPGDATPSGAGQRDLQ
ncbi:MAP3K4, partial [Symbiodinium sp. CCMP2456]